MAIASQLLMDEETRDALLALNAQSPSYQMVPRIINNPLANQLGLGILEGMYVASANVLNQQTEYAAFLPICSQLPIYIFDSEILFYEEPL